MKYTLQIAFSEPVGDIILRVCEYAGKFGDNKSKYLNPLLFSFSGNSIEVKRPEKDCPIADAVILAMELHSGIPLKWATTNASTILHDGAEVLEFFEREFSDKIIDQDDIDPEMHIVFYAPLYEVDIYKRVQYVLQNLPVGHKFIVNVIGIPSDIAWACKLLNGDSSRESLTASMINNITEITKLTSIEESSCNTLIRHIFIFQNYNLSGWSQNFTKKKLIEVSANLSLALVEHYDTICHYSWLERPIYAINLKSRIIDLYLAVDHIFRNLFKDVAQDNIIDGDTINRDKVKNAYVEILEEEIKLIKEYKQHFLSGLEEQDVYDNYFDEFVKQKIKTAIIQSIERYQLNISEQHFLYSLFAQITDKTDFESPAFDESTWQLEEMILRELNVVDGSDLMTTFYELKKCSNNISDIKKQIEADEKKIDELKEKLDNAEGYSGELTEEGFKIGEEVFKPYHIQDKPLDVTYEIPQDQVIPSSVDLRKDFSEIRNQGAQGACSAFSLVSVIEYYLHKIFNKKIDLSESFTYYNARAIDNKTEVDEGTTFYDVIKGAMDFGICLKNLCPYDEKVFNEKPSSEAYSEAESRKITEAKNVKVSVNDIKSAIAQGFPVVISTAAFPQYVENYDGVIDPNIDFNNSDTGHAVALCGYSDREGYFLLRNSWGTGKGKGLNGSGYYLLPYDCIRRKDYIRGAYAVTGLNIDGLERGDLPELDSILKGRTVNAQYTIYQNMLRETTRQLADNRSMLSKLQADYLNLFNQIADYSNVELTLKELKEKTDEQREELERQLRDIAETIDEENKKKGFFTNIFGGNRGKQYAIKKKDIEAELGKLDHYGDDVKREYRITVALLNGLRSVNLELLQESIRRQQLSEFYTVESDKIDSKTEEEKTQLEFLRKILPLDDILSRIKMSDITSLMSEFGTTISKVINGDIGLYETLSDIQGQLIRRITSEFDINIADYLQGDLYSSFYQDITKSSVMAQIDGGVPSGYGDETKYFFCNIDKLPQQIARDNDDVHLLPIKDKLRMSFLHIEKYNKEDFIIFKESNSSMIN